VAGVPIASFAMVFGDGDEVCKEVVGVKRTSGSTRPLGVSRW